MGQGSLDVFHQQHQVKFGSLTSFKSVPGVKGNSARIHRMNEDGASADYLRASKSSLQAVFEKCRTQSSALFGLIHSQAR